MIGRAGLDVAARMQRQKQRKYMKGYGQILLSRLLLFVLTGFSAGCVENTPGPEEEPGQDTPVPVTLHAGSRTKAVVDAGDTFDPLLVCSSTGGEYTSLLWQKKVSVVTDGAVTYTEEIPVYPPLGDYIYVTGLHPQDAVISEGNAVYRLDGRMDLMLASEQAGNRWDGFRLHGNSDPAKNKPLEFDHLLTLLRLTAIRTAGGGLTGQKEFRIQAVRLKEVPQTATVRIGRVGEGEEQVIWSAPALLSAGLYKDKNDKYILITSSDAENPDEVGYVLLPPAEFYLADIETTIGTFYDIRIRPDEGVFTRGLAHRVVMVFNDKGLSIQGVRLEDWLLTEGGNIDMN